MSGYQGGPSESGRRHVSAGEAACRPSALAPACETLEAQASPASATSGGLAEQHLEEMFDMGSIPQSAPSSATPTSVYRYYDANDLLLYVGITARATTRQREHNGDKEWWQYVVRQEVEHYPSRPHAESREQGLIRRYRPPFNTRHNPGASEVRAAYLDLIAGRVVQPGLLVSRSVNRESGRTIPLHVETASPSSVLLVSSLADALATSTLDVTDLSRINVGSGGRKAYPVYARHTKDGELVIRVNAARFLSRCLGGDLMLRFEPKTVTIKRLDLRFPAGRKVD